MFCHRVKTNTETVFVYVNRSLISQQLSTEIQGLGQGEEIGRGWSRRHGLNIWNLRLRAYDVTTGAPITSNRSFFFFTQRRHGKPLLSATTRVARKPPNRSRTRASHSVRGLKEESLVPGEKKHSKSTPSNSQDFSQMRQKWVSVYDTF